MLTSLVTMPLHRLRSAKVEHGRKCPNSLHHSYSVNTATRPNTPATNGPKVLTPLWKFHVFSSFVTFNCSYSSGSITASSKGSNSSIGVIPPYLFPLPFGSPSFPFAVGLGLLARGVVGVTFTPIPVDCGPAGLEAEVATSDTQSSFFDGVSMKKMV